MPRERKTVRNDGADLYTGRVNAGVVNLLLENARFVELTYRISQYFDDTFASGIAAQNAMQPQSIMEKQESRRELYDGLKRLTQREQTYLLYRYGFTDGEEHPLIGTAIYFHLTKSRAKKTEEQAIDNLWLELPWWFD